MALPDFFVAGAPKAGTTALHAALARHPALYMSAVKEPKFFLTDGPPPTAGWTWRCQDIPGARLAPGRLRVAVRSGPGRHAARRVDAVLPVQPRCAAAHQGPRPARQAHRRGARPGRAGALQLDPPVVGRARPDRRLRPRMRRRRAADRGGLGRLLALQADRPVRAAGPAAVLDLPPQPGPAVPVPRPHRRPGGHAGPDLRLPRHRAGPDRGGAAGERHSAPRADAGGTRICPGCCAPAQRRLQGCRSIPAS